MPDALYALTFLFQCSIQRILSTTVYASSCYSVKLVTKNTQNIFAKNTSISRDSSVGIATRYGLDSPGIESRWGRDFPSHPHQPWSPPSLLHNGYWVSFPGVKRLGRGVDHPPSSSARVKERVELYLCFPSGPSWPFLDRTLPVPCTSISM
jgi:hypothetical protein